MQFNNTLNNLGNNFVKVSPYISFGVGVVSFVGAIASCVRATMRLEPILDEYIEKKQELDLYLENVKEEGAVSDETEPVVIEKNTKKSKE